ncbi:NUDIX domain-containing protein [Oerskovia paurometabola]|uniref:NUDIX domain-containing protein n=1 Tax=Oerskovia paurometabola TaxID=162170 RepID=A0ABW1X9R9_9CELL|nr:NUDIX domain-containing protein [Oerskovia paurometabola]MBM7498835.1 putative NUDIX family NTP pyrophosphohydrolase [Oerskovia paurometabola]
MVTSAGLLLYRVADDGAVEVLLGHMGGPLWARKDERAWTIPKGEHTPDEDPHDAAVREFTEELGSSPPDGPEVDLGEIRQRGGKTVRAWARRADFDVSTAVSNTFEMEWPPRSGRRARFPELDRVEWVPFGRARDLVVAGQVALLDRLEEALTEP